MALEKWHPLTELEHMRKEMERIWDEFLPSPRRAVLTPWKRLVGEGDVTLPAVDIIDRDEEILVKIEMPGVSKENIDVSVQENTLTVKGEIKEEKEEKEENYLRRERTYRTFERSINIPVKVAPDKIKAGLRDGILYVHLPKAEETKPRKIKVEVA